MKTATNPIPSLYSAQRRFDVLAGVREIIGRNIQRLIEVTPGMSKARLAAALKTGPSNVSRWVRGMALPTAENIDAMAALFNVSVSELFDGNLADSKRLDPEDILKLFAASQGYAIKKVKK